MYFNITNSTQVIDTQNIGWNISSKKSRSRSKSPQLQDEYLHNVGRFLLKDVVFYGHYMEKNRVTLLESYRDLIVVSNSEIEFKRKLDELIKIFHEKYTNKNIWLGVTNTCQSGSPAGHCIWTDLGSQIPFGQYWFQVRRITFRENEIYLKLKCLREYIKEDKIDGILKPEPWDKTQYDPATIAKNFTELFESWKKSWREFLFWFCSVRLTFENFKSFIRFIFLLIISIFFGVVHGIEFMANFIILFLHHSSHFIRASTPFLLGVINCLSKCVGGFYILIAMMWREIFKPRDPRNAIVPRSTIDRRYSGYYRIPNNN